MGGNASIKKEINRLMKIEGEVRGVVFKTDAEYVTRKAGEKGLKSVERKLKEWGQPIEYQRVKTMDFYPIGLRALSLLAIRDALGWEDEEIRQMGFVAPKISLVIKLFMKYFLSITRTTREISKMWRKHYTLGELVPVEVSEKEQYVILRLRGLNLSPLFCLYLTGYVASICEMIVKSPVTCKETYCHFRGDKFHQYLVKW